MPRKTRSGTITNDVGLWLDETAFALQNDEDEYTQFSLNLGTETDSDVASACSTPPPRLRLDVDVVQRKREEKKKKMVSRDCGICFEYATTPVQAECCGHVFCAEHLSRWLQGPASDGLCPACRAPSTSFPHSVPATAATSPTEIISPLSSITASSSTSAQTTLTPSSWRSTHTEAEEDKTDYSFPALTQARVLQSRRHTSHSLSSVIGLQGALFSVARVLLGVILVAVLAGRGSGRWAAAEL